MGILLGNGPGWIVRSRDALGCGRNVRAGQRYYLVLDGTRRDGCCVVPKLTVRVRFPSLAPQTEALVRTDGPPGLPRCWVTLKQG